MNEISGKLNGMNEEIVHVHRYENSIVSRYQFSEIYLYVQWNTNQNPRKLFCEYWQTDSKDYMEKQKTQNSQPKIGGQEKSWRTDLLNAKIHYKAKATKKGWYW